ncbi:MAG: hypothetical protein V3V08_18345 [Nannocystaceae bacterium]
MGGLPTIHPPARLPPLLRRFRFLPVLGLVAYPLLVHAGLSNHGPRLAALLVLILLTPAILTRFRGQRRSASSLLAAIPSITATALFLAAVLDAADLLLFLPTLINASLLVVFGLTLRGRTRTPMIESFARLVEPDLSPEKQRWCRWWTWIWSAFFAVNATVAAILAASASLAFWTVYNGGVAYVVMGCLFATEYLLRRHRFGPTGGRQRSPP